MYSFETKLVKSSRKKLVISGNNFTFFEYQKPVFYNFPPMMKVEGIIKKNRLRREDNLRRTRTRIANLVNANANFWHQKPKFVTLTFANEVEDINEALKHWDTFKRRLVALYGPLKYLTVMEIQHKRLEKTGKAVWHFHAVFFNLPFIYGGKQVISDLWGQGFVKINAVEKVKNTGAYVCKYMQKGNEEVRLNGKKAFFVSRGLKQPEILRTTKNINKFFTKNNIMLESECQYTNQYLGLTTIKTGKYVNNY